MESDAVVSPPELAVDNVRVFGTPPATATNKRTEKTEDDESRQRRKLELRQKNLAAASSRPDESFFRKLDSNLKKNTAFVKKLKTFTEQQRDSVVRDFGGLNLSKYAAEMASSITEAKLRLSDVPAVIDVCSLAHQRYADFAPSLLDYFKKTFPRRKDEKIANMSKFRVDLRLLAELILCGVLSEKEALSVLGAALNYLVQTDKEEHINLAVINTFCKYCGDDFAALAVHRGVQQQQQQQQQPQSSANGPPKEGSAPAEGSASSVPSIVSAENQKKVYNLLCDYYDSLQRHLQRSQRDMQKMERQNRWQYENKGEVHPDAVQRLDEARANFDKLFQSANVFADLLSRERFQAARSDQADVGESGDQAAAGGDLRYVVVQAGGTAQATAGDGAAVAESVWEDEDTRMFYETLPELRAMLPSILFKDAEEQQSAEAAAATATAGSVSTVATATPTLEDVIAEADESSAAGSDIDAKDVGPDDEKSDRIGATTMTGESDIDDQALVVSGGEDVDDAQLAGEAVETEEDADAGDKCSGSTLRQMMDTFISQLPNLINRDMIDQAAIDFVTNLNTKTNRKRLVKAVFNVHRTRLDLLPFYSRLVATLNPVMPDVGTELCKMLIANFRHQVRKKDQILIETKVKIVRFVGELVKFRIFPKAEALHCLKILLFDLRHHNIDMACNLLDSCGYFLYHSPDSYQKTKVLLEQMMRKRQAALHLDQRYQLMINNAYYTCNPPTAGSAGLTPKIERTPMQEYIRKLIFSDLSKISVEHVLVQMRKLDWDDQAVARYAVHCLSQPWNVKYNCIQWLASLLAGIMYYYDRVGYQVVDNIVEEIRIGMEVNHHKLNQRRICCMKYLGEMYNYRVVDSAIIFSVLYSLVTFGVIGEPKAQSPVDPPEHLLRIRLACVILDTCGAYFDRGTSRKKLDCFLLYLQRYWLMKKSSDFWTSPEHPFPAEVDDVFLETIEHLRHNFKLAESFEEASKKVKDLEAEYKAKVESALKFVQPVEREVSSAECAPEEDEGDFAGPPHPEDADDDGFTGTGSQEGASQGSREPRSLSQKENAWPSRLPNDDEEETGVTVHWKTNAETDQTAEDEEFMKEFDKMMAEMMQQRASDQLKVPQVEFTVPTNVRAKASAKTKFEDEDVNEEGEEGPVKDKDTVNFYLMTKGKGSKLTLKTLKIPISSDFAVALKDREEAELREKEKMKKLTLDMSRRMEEEEIAEIEGGGPRVFSAIDQKKANQQPRFQHQKGAPNPHEIFSNRWFR